MMLDNGDFCSSLPDTVIQDIAFAVPVAGMSAKVMRLLSMLLHQNSLGVLQRNQQAVLKAILAAERERHRGDPLPRRDHWSHGQAPTRCFAQCPRISAAEQPSGFSTSSP